MPTTNYGIPYFSGSAAADDVSGTSQPPLDAVDMALKAIADALSASLPKFNGTEVALVGANPPAGTVVIQHRLHVVANTTSASGDFVMNFPSAFPNGLVGFMANPNSGCSMTPGYKPLYSLSRGWVLCLAGASVAVANGSACDVTGIAWGW